MLLTKVSGPHAHHLGCMLYTREGLCAVGSWRDLLLDHVAKAHILVQ